LPGEFYESPSESQDRVFDPELFRETSGMATDRVHSYLSDLSIRGLALTDPAILLRAARSLMTAEHDTIAAFDEKRLAALIDLYVKTGIQVHSPGSMGRQFGSVVPLAGVIDFVSSMVSQPSSFYEAGQLPNVAERIMADELSRFIGWDAAKSVMVTTSGGSLANLTALLAARNIAFPGIWASGECDGPGRPAIAVSEEAHYSIRRTAGVLGIGAAQIVRIPVNRYQQIRADQAGDALDAAKRRGLTVFCLVASAGTTATGAFDPICELADIAAERGIWLHVDGAHGASMLLSDKHRRKMGGIEKADSLVWDAHKMMFVPAPCTMLFYRDGKAALEAFREKASYVFDEAPDFHSKLDSGDKNFECTKRPMIMPLWALWAIYGPALFAEKIEHLCRLAENAYEILLEQPDFEVIHRPEANILCFRYRPRGVEERWLHDLQLAIWKCIRANGEFFISKADIRGMAALRIVMMNHRINADHVKALIAEIRRAGWDLYRARAETRGE
jgi:L-2,4-diaminobutyrate decarboxylase